MFSQISIFSRINLRNSLNGSTKCFVHYKIGKNGEKIVVSKRYNIKTSREKWQNVRPMGYEPELREIKAIERNDRLHSDPKMARMTALNKMVQLKNKLVTAGFCRDRKSYNPPEDLESRITKIFKDILNTSQESFALRDPKLKFKVLTACAQEFNHEVSNSVLHEMKALENVKEFYATPVRGTNSYDDMVNHSNVLPKNLQVIPEPIRFNPETDTYFGGVDAYPGISRELPGLRAKKRYPSKPNRFEWPDV